MDVGGLMVLNMRYEFAAAGGQIPTSSRLRDADFGQVYFVIGNNGHLLDLAVRY